jgi:hypothetical protein
MEEGAGAKASSLPVRNRPVRHNAHHPGCGTIAIDSEVLISFQRNGRIQRPSRKCWLIQQLEPRGWFSAIVATGGVRIPGR